MLKKSVAIQMHSCGFSETSGIHVSITDRRYEGRKFHGKAILCVNMATGRKEVHMSEAKTLTHVILHSLDFVLSIQ